MFETADVVTIYYEIYQSRLLLVIPFTILVYDYLLTLSREVSGFWGLRRPTWSTVFFFLNRYGSIFGTIPIIVQYFSTTTDPTKYAVCRVYTMYHQYFALFSQVCVAVMLMMRTYALYERSRTILAFMLAVTLAAFSFAVYRILGSDDDNTLSPLLQSFGCPVATARPKSVRLGEAWSMMLVFDVMIFGLTLWKALRLYAKHGVTSRTGRSGGLVEILLRDGSVYFALMVIANAFNIASYTMTGVCSSSTYFMLSLTLFQPMLRGSATTVTNVTSSVMISRLMLNLRAPSSSSFFFTPNSGTRSNSGSTLTRTGHGASAFASRGYGDTRTAGPALTTVAPYYTEHEDEDGEGYALEELGVGLDSEGSGSKGKQKTRWKDRDVRELRRAYLRSGRPCVSRRVIIRMAQVSGSDSKTMSSPVASLDVQAAYVEGPVLIGTCVSLVLLGVVSGQTVKFLSNPNGDSWRLRVYVGLVGLLVALQSIFDFYLILFRLFSAALTIPSVRLWQQAITHFGIVKPPILLGLPRDLILKPIINFMVEAYYIYRLAALSKRNFFVLVPIGTVLLSTFVLHVTVIFEEQTFTVQRVRKVILLYKVILPLYFVGDLLLTMSTTAYLYHFRRNVLPQNATVITQLIRLVFQTSTPATCGIIVNFLFALNFPDIPGVLAAKQWAGFGVNLVIPDLFAVSVLWTINARGDMDQRRKIQASDRLRGHGESTHGAGGWGSGKVYVSRMSRGSGMEGAIERFREISEENRNKEAVCGQGPASTPGSGHAAVLPLSRNSSHVGSQEIDGRVGSGSGPEMCFADSQDVESARKSSDCEVSRGSSDRARDWR
uniref:DUF6533 domain-containing protein n=1 Tax=Mycena chlorophos TaxID=658473 RepID=A0ABQ0KWL0_MYCCL|nr:predicted protein [Mycena chlorophos]